MELTEQQRQSVTEWLAAGASLGGEGMQMAPAEPPSDEPPPTTHR